MGAWGTSIFSDDLAMDVRGEYNALLGLGKEGEEADKLMVQYFLSGIREANAVDDEAVFWFALALAQWKKGRLGEIAKLMALHNLELGIDQARWKQTSDEKTYQKRLKVLEEFEKTILSPMPPKKKVRKPTVHHCPWRVGSLLAYRIVTNEKLKKENHPLFNKYALLRVIELKRYPVSKILPNELYEERMIVGLYNWAGDEIPDPEIIKNLQFIPVADYLQKGPGRPWDLTGFEAFSEEEQQKILEGMNRLIGRRMETCADLNWHISRKEKGDITYLGMDTSFQEKIPDFFDTSVTAYAMTHFIPFDYDIAHRLEPYYKGKDKK